MPGSLITIARPSASSRSAFSYHNAAATVISPAATIAATRAAISSSDRCGGVGHHQRISVDSARSWRQRRVAHCARPLHGGIKLGCGCLRAIGYLRL